MTVPRGGPVSTHANSRSVILDAVRAAGTISRVEIVRQTGLTGATVSTVVRRLIDEGIVAEIGTAESTGGKPRTILRLEPSARYAVGVHLDHGGVTYVVTDLAGEIVARTRRPGIGDAGPQDVVTRITGEIGALVAVAGVARSRLLGVGVCLPGPVFQTPADAVVPPTIAQWSDFPLRDALERSVGLPTLMDNDATAGALGEHWARGVPGSVCFGAVYMGTGIGGGLVVGGVPYWGASGNTMEIGHVCVDLDGPPCWCGNRGCVEALAGPATVVAAARAAGLLDGPPRSVVADFAAVARAASQGDDAALALLQDSARYVAVAAHTMATVMDADHVVLTGPSFGAAGAIYLPAVREELEKRYFARGTHPVGVTISQHAYEAAAVGAAAMVLQTELVPRQLGIVLPAAGRRDTATTATTAARPLQDAPGPASAAG